MNLRNKLAIITSAAAIALVGTGFAAWAFTAEQAADSDAIDKVAVGVELSDGFALYNAANNALVEHLYLICDAPTDKPAIALAGDGVYWASDAAGANAIASVYMKGTLSKAAEDSVKDISTVTVSFTASHNLASDYINFGAFAAIDNEVVDAVNGEDVQSDAFTLPTVSYVEAELPHNITELTAMNTALATDLDGKAITCTAQIIAKA